MLTKLIDVCLINKYPQLDASGLEDLRTSTGNVKLLPSSKDYDWVSNYETSKDYLCDGEVITLGKARYANIKYYKGLFVSANNVIVESKNQNIVLTKFLYYYCLKNNKNFYVEGTTYPKFDMPSFSNSIVDVPSISEQKSIIGSLDTILHLIENEEKQLKLYDELIKSRFIEMFMDTNNKDKYPLKKWVDVVKVKHGKDYKKNIVENGGYPVYGSGGFMGVYTDNYLVEENATIIGRKGTIDKPILVKEKFWNVDTAFGIEANKDVLNPIFFYVRSTMYDLKSMSTSTTLPSMTKDTLHGIEIGIPPIELQNEFALFVEQIDKSKFINYSRYFLWEFLTLFSSTIAYSSVVSILA